MSLQDFRKDPMRYLQRLANDFGDIATFKLGPIQAVLVNHPDLIREVLVSQVDKFPKMGRQTKTIRLIDGNSLFVKEGEQWLNDRRLIQSALHPDFLPAYAEHVLIQTQNRISSWASGQTLDFSDETTELAILIAGKTIFGTDLQPLARQLRQTSHIRADVFVREMSSHVRLPDNWPLPSKRQKRKVIQTMDDMIYGVMREKRRGTITPQQDLLSFVMSAAEEVGMSDQQIRDHASLMYQAAVDDMGSAMVWMFYLIAKNAETQSRIKREISTTVGDRPVEMADLPRLPFVKQVINESMRLYPATWLFTARKARADAQVGQYEIKHRTWVFLSPYVTQRDSRFFENPTNFDPDRFSTERFGKRQKSAFFPFGMGPRGCAGARQVMVQLALIATNVLQQFELTLAPNSENVKPIPKVTVRPGSAIRIRVERRKAASNAA